MGLPPASRLHRTLLIVIHIIHARPIYRPSPPERKLYERESNLVRLETFVCAKLPRHKISHDANQHTARPNPKLTRQSRRRTISLRMNPRPHAGFTLVEFIICLAVVGILIFLAMPRISCGPISGTQTQTLSNMKQLHLATQQMALDGTTTTNLTIGWPGDIGGGFSNWTAQLLKGNYLSKNDLCKLLSAPGVIVSAKDTLATNDTALLLYAVKEDSDGGTVFLTTANFTNTPTGGTPLSLSAKPYGTKGFIVFRKAGDGAILAAKQVGMTNVIGAYAPLCP